MSNKTLLVATSKCITTSNKKLLLMRCFQLQDVGSEIVASSWACHALVSDTSSFGAVNEVSFCPDKGTHSKFYSLKMSGLYTSSC